MTPRKMGLLLVSILLAGMMLWLRTAQATETASGESVLMSQERVIEDDVAVAGRTVTVNARVRGDVLAAGQNVLVSGQIQGSVMAAGADVTVRGPVGDDVRVAGMHVTLEAPIGDNLQAFGGTVTLNRASRVQRDADIAGSEVQIEGKIGRNLDVGAENVRLAGEVGGSVRVNATRISVLPGTVIHGDLLVSGPNPPEIASEARVLGHVGYRFVDTGSAGSSAGSWLFGWLFQALSLLLMGAIAIAYSPRWVERVGETLVRHPGLAALTGLSGLVVVPLAFIVLLITLIGLPLAFLILVLYVAMLLLAGVFVACLLGGWLSRQFKHPESSPYAHLAVGVLVLSVLMAMPWIGWLIRLAVLILGSGALVWERRSFRQRLRAEGLS